MLQSGALTTIAMPTTPPIDPEALAQSAFHKMQSILEPGYQTKPGLAMKRDCSQTMRAAAMNDDALARLEALVRGRRWFSIPPSQIGTWDAIEAIDPALADALANLGRLSIEHTHVFQWAEESLDIWGIRWVKPQELVFLSCSCWIRGSFDNEGYNNAPLSTHRKGPAPGPVPLQIQHAIRRCLALARARPDGQEELEIGRKLAAATLPAMAAASGDEATLAGKRLRQCAGLFGIPSADASVQSMAKDCAKAAKAAKAQAPWIDWGEAFQASFKSDNVQLLEALFIGAKAQKKDAKLLMARFRQCGQEPGALRPLLWHALHHNAPACARWLIEKGADFGMVFFEDFALENTNLISCVAWKLKTTMTESSPERRLFIDVSLAMAQHMSDHGFDKATAANLCEKATAWMNAISDGELLSAMEPALVEQSLALSKWLGAGAPDEPQAQSTARRSVRI